MQKAYPKLFSDPIPSVDIGIEELTIVSCVYNEELRIHDFLKHHRNIGVTRFFIVDNSSTDNTKAILEQQSDVILLHSDLPYSEYRSSWWSSIGDLNLVGRWVLLADADELFIYPGWPDRSVTELIRSLNDEAAEAMFTSMVDMYSDHPIRDLQYQSGQSLLETCPFFDSDSYCMLPNDKDPVFNTPPYHLYGGPRNRLFASLPKQRSILDQLLISKLYGLHPFQVQSTVGRYIRRRIWKTLQIHFPSPRAAMSKLPLIRWNPEYRFKRGPHSLNRKVKIGSEWGALLHFKYLQDFATKTYAAIDRGQHFNNAEHYRGYLPSMNEILSNSPVYSGSRRLYNGNSLEEHGLMRRTER